MIESNDTRDIAQPLIVIRGTKESVDVVEELGSL